MSKTKTKRGPGKPKTIVPEKEMREAEKLARKGHKNYTICNLMGWHENFINEHKDILKRLQKSRSQHADDILADQNRIRKSNSRAAATIAILQGKQAEKDGGLGQTDKIEADVTQRILNVTGMEPISAD